MKKICTLFVAVLVLVACGTKSTNKCSDVNNNSDFSVSASYKSASNLEEYYDFYGEDELDFGNIEEDTYSTISIANSDNYYNAYSDCYGNITITDMNGNFYHGSVDGFGNTSWYDSDGNYYHTYTDDFGNTTGYDSEGNHYHSYTDDFGNTSVYDSNGNYYHSYTDDFGNTTGYDSNGNSYNAYTDDFGNTTINIY